MASPQLQLVNEFERGFGEGDAEVLRKCIHKDFRRNIYPKSLGIAESAGDEWLRRMAEIAKYTTERKTTRHSVTEVPGKIITHATTEVKTSAGADIQRESLYIIHVTADGDGNLKIILFEEFTDSHTYHSLYQAAEKAKG